MGVPAEPLFDGQFDDGYTAGKADGTAFTECETNAMLTFVNDGATTLDVLKNAGVHSRASQNIIGYRSGADEQFGTDDDVSFGDVQQLDDVYYVGPAAFRQLAAHIASRCEVTGSIEVIFSPTSFEESHLARIIELIDGAQYSIDIAMYSFRDQRLLPPLERALARGVSIRLIFESANQDRRDPEGTMSERFELLGIDVRWINRVMHHKFALIDGPRESLASAETARLVTGSGNWSSSAATKYDENTLIINGNVELILSFQQEFNHLWENSRPLDINTDLSYFTSMAISDDQIEDNASVDVLFTSANFDTYVSSQHGPTFSVIRGENEVSDRLVELIEGATTSIDIASGHLRLRPVVEALIALHERNPDVAIRLYLDGQEYISNWSHENQLEELAECLEAAGDSETRRQDCTDRGFLFGYAAALAGLSVRYQYYSYRWHYSYAVQMHHKYLIIDGRILATGSYNLSDNAEHNTMENIVILDGAAYPDLVNAYATNFEQIWTTGESEQLYEQLVQQIETANDGFPIVFEPMALDWDQVTALKDLIRDRCPQINSAEFRNSPQSHRWCSLGE